MAINVQEIKQKIIKLLDERGPSLPIHITKVSGLNLMFTSAILSELLNEKKVKTSYLRIGSSSLYLLPGQEPKLEGFSDNLNGFEKEAFLKLKENKFLEEDKQDPAIRVALKSIKDFAIPVKREDKVYWKYFLLSNKELENLLDKGTQEIRKVTSQVWQDIEKEKDKEETKGRINKIASEIEGTQKELEKSKEEVLEKVLSQQNPANSMRLKKKKDTKFSLEIKEKLRQKGAIIEEEIYLGRKEVLAKIFIENKEHILLAFDKKKISDSDLLKLMKKTQLKLPLYILAKGEIPKKMKDLIELYKNLSHSDLI
jgi:hypothetical protein